MKKLLRVRKLLALALTVGMISTATVLVPAVESSAAGIDWNTYPVPTISEKTLAKAYPFIGKTMYLLSSGQRVRIAVTGQSISDGGNTWAPDLIKYLQEKYPAATVEYKNFAIGGFATGCLKKRMYNDIVSFNPDLVILYDYGSNDEYEYMVKTVKENTEAEMLFQTDHYTGEDEWSETMSVGFIPKIAETYKCGVAQIRSTWKKYITNNFGGDASVLLQSDMTHLNSDGQTFMLGLMKQFFIEPDNSNAKELIDAHTVKVSDSDWKDGVLEVSGTGTRAEVIAGDGTQYECSVLVDGKKPSEYPDCYIRSAESNGMYGTIIGEIDYNGVPGEQKWTITFDSYSNNSTFKYSVSGEKSGSQGTSDANGNLNGSILKMSANSFIFDFAPPAPGTTYTFNSILNGTDKYDGKTGYEENKQVLFNFKNDGKGNAHTVKLTAADASKIPDIKAIRFYDPALIVTATEKGGTPAPSATATPTPSASASATATPSASTSASATANPSASAASASATATSSASASASATTATSESAKPTDNNNSDKKVTIKFAKKAVKLKKGKKVTLKIKLSGAKKATFSVNKGKIVKILKKKAKAVTIKGLKKGKAVVTAKASGKKTTCKVTVK